jgi:uncharacterized membrane protein
MNKQLARWSYITGIFSVAALLLLIIIFIVSESFDLFRFSEIAFAILPVLLGLGAGSFMINVMSNLNHIAENCGLSHPEE